MELLERGFKKEFPQTIRITEFCIERGFNKIQSTSDTAMIIINLLFREIFSKPLK